MSYKSETAENCTSVIRALPESETSALIGSSDGIGKAHMGNVDCGVVVKRKTEVESDTRQMSQAAKCNARTRK